MKLKYECFLFNKSDSIRMLILLQLHYFNINVLMSGLVVKLLCSEEAKASGNKGTCPPPQVF